MAEAEDILYCKQENNEEMKVAVRSVGAKPAFLRDMGAYRLVTDGLSPEEVAAAREALQQYMSPEAKAEWTQDREQRLAKLEADKSVVREGARAREGTTTEQRPERAPGELGPNQLRAYPSHSQKKDFHKLLVETSSQGPYRKGNKHHGAHYLVTTTRPELFSQYVGPEAEKRFVDEHKARGDKDHLATEPKGVVAAEAAKRSGKAFMAQYATRGFLLSDPKHDKDNHLGQLNSMRDATVRQVLAVLAVSREKLNGLRDKEATMRAEAAGIPVEQVKQMSWTQQKAITREDGTAVGLVGTDFTLHAQLSRGVRAMEVELDARNVGQKRDRSQEQSQQQGQARESDREQKAPGRTISEDKSADDAFLAVQTAAAARRRGAGR